MVSTIFHLSFGLLIGTALIENKFDIWAFLTVAIFSLLPDVDTFFNIWFLGAHRTYLHNLFIPVILSGLLYFDIRRENSFIEKHWESGKKVLKVSIIALLVAGIGIDMFGSGVNLFYPVQDQFYDFSGKIEFGTKSGLVQTIFKLDDIDRGSTETMKYTATHSKEKTPQKEEVNKIYLISANGVRFFFGIAGILIAGYRVWDTHKKHNNDKIESIKT